MREVGGQGEGSLTVKVDLMDRVDRKWRCKFYYTDIKPTGMQIKRVVKVKHGQQSLINIGHQGSESLHRDTLSNVLAI